MSSSSEQLHLYSFSLLYSILVGKKFRSRRANLKMDIEKYKRLLKEKIVIFDGAMGTNLQRFNPSLDDYQGKDGCNEVLCLSRPEWIKQIHSDFFAVGCDFVETNSFGANRIVLDEYGLAGQVLELNRAAAQLAREIAKQFSTSAQPRFVAGSMGPGTKLPSLGHITFDLLRQSYEEQARGLLEGGADLLLIETCQDLLQVKAAVNGALGAQKALKITVPITVQVTMESTGTMLLGSDMATAITVIECFPVQTIGLNCATGPMEMGSHVRVLSQMTDRFISVLPNAGLPENIGGKAVYKLTPDELAKFILQFVNESGVNIVGGCCGTTREHLQKVVETVGKLTPSPRSISRNARIASLYQSVPLRQEPPPLIVGERTNANGSKAFRDILNANDFDSSVHLANTQEKEGAHAIDVCTAFVGRDEIKDMSEVIRRFALQVKAPLMIDSTEANVIETALKLLGGKSIVNSINLEDGEERLHRICPLLKTYGAAVVALTIDEEGMAKTADKKLAIAKRIYKLATGKFGIPPDDLIFDALTFTLGSGDEDLRKAGLETIKAVKLIKSEFPESHTLLGVSNVSFGLNPSARSVLNSVFLHYALEAGLDLAIVNFQKITPYLKIKNTWRDLARQIIFDERKFGPDGALLFDPLKEFLASFSNSASGPVSLSRDASLSVEEELRGRIIDGNNQNIEDLLAKALAKYSALDIINKFLLEGMRKVGELFGSGQIQLPFVLQSAEVMKTAVKFLEPRIPKSEKDRKRGKILLATVKGDVHDIGKNLVDIILTNNGYEVINLGIKQPIENILKAAETHQPDAIGLSGLLVKSTNVMKEDLEELNRRNLKYRVLLGGAALTRKFVEKELRPLYKGQVYYALDAFEGLRIMDELTNPRSQKKLTANYSSSPAEKLAGIVSQSSQVLSPDAGIGKSLVKPAPLIPKPPFWGSKIVKNIDVEEIFPFINETALLKVRWGFKRVPSTTTEEYQKMLKEKVEPLFNKWKARVVKDKLFQPQVAYGYFPCFSDKDSLIVLKSDLKTESMRFDFPRQKKPPFLCISDYFLSKNTGKIDVIGMMLVTIGAVATPKIQEKFKGGEYTDYLFLHGLSVETTEALAEFWHKKMRIDLKIEGSDATQIRDLFHQHYQGSRYSFGYPACPALEDQAKILGLLKAERIGVELSETFQLHPEQTTSAIIVHHPEAKYFSVD